MDEEKKIISNTYNDYKNTMNLYIVNCNFK